ncbi:MAG: ribonuclease E/G [Hespellia sp.]|nr:ribonuclease E/G [Hespellia sp.]
MKRKVIITQKDEKILTALVEDGEVVELRISPSQKEALAPELGEIYIGKVQKILSNIGAAFIDIGKGIDCYYDMHQKATPIFTAKAGKKNPEVLCTGDELLLQVSREAVKTKAPTVSSKLEFSGQYVVLTVGNMTLGMSSRLSTEQKAHYREMMQPFSNESYGFILRTNAGTATDEMIREEVQQLIAEFEQIRDAAMTRTCFSCLRTSEAPYLTELKDIYQEGLEEYLVEDASLYQKIKAYLTAVLPQNVEKLHFYEDTNYTLVHRFSLDKVLHDALSEKVWLKSGGYLVIQPTEALTVVDVNSGKTGTKKGRGASNLLKVNIEAAKETARQIRLRNLSGIVVIDFINMDASEEWAELIRILKQSLYLDPVQVNYIDTTALQLVELTRKKVRRPLHECMSK